MYLPEIDGPSLWYVLSSPRIWPFLKPAKTGAIDDVHRAVTSCEDTEKATEGKSIVEGLAKLKYELQHNRQLTLEIGTSISQSARR